MYYAIHQMFFTRGSVYMVVWNLCQPEEAQKVEFWLNAIRSRADDLAIILGMFTHNFIHKEGREINKKNERKAQEKSITCCTSLKKSKRSNFEKAN
jgi:hypothetical protein